MTSMSLYLLLSPGGGFILGFDPAARIVGIIVEKNKMISKF